MQLRVKAGSLKALTQRPVLAQEPVEIEDDECAAILAMLDRPSVKGALVTIDAIATTGAYRGGDPQRFGGIEGMHWD